MQQWKCEWSNVSHLINLKTARCIYFYKKKVETQALSRPLIRCPRPIMKERAVKRVRASAVKTARRPAGAWRHNLRKVDVTKAKWGHTPDKRPQKRSCLYFFLLKINASGDSCCFENVNMIKSEIAEQKKCLEKKLKNRKRCITHTNAQLWECPRSKYWNHRSHRRADGRCCWNQHWWCQRRSPACTFAAPGRRECQTGGLSRHPNPWRKRSHWENAA